MRIRAEIHFVLLIGVALLSGCHRHETQTGVKTIHVWYPFGGDTTSQLEQIVDQFSATHPNIHVELSFAANNLTGSQKLFLAIAAGTAPDVTFVDGQQLAEWAARGALTDITDQVKKAHLGADDFWLPRWKESNFNGRTYALPWGADPNFAFVWNKTEFREAGLDPDRPPRTLDELAADAKKLTKYDADGRIERIGFVPWEFGYDNAMFTFGYLFGGDFYVEPPPSKLIGTVTADNPRNIAALQWLSDYAKQYDVRKLNAIHDNSAGLENNPFYVGTEAMSFMHIMQMAEMRKYAPTMDYGIAPEPAPPGGEYPSGWIGGWSLAIPRGSAASDEAFEFMRWMCISDTSTKMMGQIMTQFPAYRKSPYFDEIKDDPKLGVYYQIVKNSKHVRTLMPVQGYLMELLRRAVEDVLYGGKDPKSELEDVSRLAQKRLVEVVGRLQTTDGGGS